MRPPRPHCFSEAAFQPLASNTEERDVGFPCMHTKQIRGRSLKSKSREIQTECRQPYSFRFPNIGKLLFKRVKYISIRRGKTLPQRSHIGLNFRHSSASGDDFHWRRLIGCWLLWLSLAVLDSLAELEKELSICLLYKNLASYKFVFLIVHERSCRKAIYHSKKGSVASFTTVGFSTTRLRLVVQPNSGK